MESLFAIFYILVKLILFNFVIAMFLMGFIMGSGYNEPRKEVSPYSWVLTKVYLGAYNLGTDFGRDSVKMYGDDKNDDL